MILAICMMLYGFLLIRQRGIAAVLMFLSGFLFLLVVKYFLLISLLPVLIAYYLFINKTSLREVASKYGGIILISLVILQALSTLDQRVNFALIIAKRQEVSLSEARYMKAGSISYIPQVKANFVSVLIHLPIGLWDALMKPYLWQSRNPMMLLSAADGITELRPGTYVYNDLRTLASWSCTPDSIAATVLTTVVSTVRKSVNSRGIRS